MEPASTVTDAVQCYDLFGLLADEIIMKVLSDSALGFLEVCRFGQTCKRHQIISYDQKIWKEKLFQMFPCVRDLAMTCLPDKDWRCQCVQLAKVSTSTCTLLHTLQQYNLGSDSISYKNFNPLGNMCDNDRFCRPVIDAMLREILYDGKPNSNLTQKYFAERMLRYITHNALKLEWTKYLALPASEQYMEDGAILIAQWCQPSTKLKSEDVKQELNKISDLVKEEIKLCHGEDHPACQKYEYGGSHTPSLSVPQCKQVLQCMNKVLYKDLGFHGNTEDYYNEMNSNINQVLENKFGIPITLSIVYEAIARRLGVGLRPVNFPVHFLLVFDTAELGISQQCIYIDAFYQGKQRTAAGCGALTGRPIPVGSDYFNRCTSKDVCLRMARNLIRLSSHFDDRQVVTALEMFLEIQPGDNDALVLLAKFYVQIRINLDEMVEKLENIPAADDVICLINQARQEINCIHMEHSDEKRRAENPEVAYSVGLVMKHRRYNYNCVIYGWDSTCDMSDEWKQQMGVYNLPHTDQQPFYNVMVDDGSNRYAAQESLKYHRDPSTISHPDIGKFFMEFNGRYYVMNSSQKRRYPDDFEVTQQKAELLSMESDVNQ